MHGPFFLLTPLLSFVIHDLPLARACVRVCVCLKNKCGIKSPLLAPSASRLMDLYIFSCKTKPGLPQFIFLKNPRPLCRAKPLSLLYLVIKSRQVTFKPERNFENEKKRKAEREREKGRAIISS